MPFCSLLGLGASFPISIGLFLLLLHYLGVPGRERAVQRDFVRVDSTVTQKTEMQLLCSPFQAHT